MSLGVIALRVETRLRDYGVGFGVYRIIGLELGSGFGVSVFQSFMCNNAHQN